MSGRLCRPSPLPGWTLSKPLPRDRTAWATPLGTGVRRCCECLPRPSGPFLGFLGGYDVLITPTTPRPPFRIGEGPEGGSFVERWSCYADTFAFCYPFNITGQPALSVYNRHRATTILLRRPV
ncbi:amidase family protein [Streptomonospora algeriensis]|uniref:Amidase family protein n=1 Tax=Streptomonospora algeriensis TaxID=995084 RepID=A0ABW3BBL1_9ACTN